MTDSTDNRFYREPTPDVHTLHRVTTERDAARDLAAKLEAQLAAVEALANYWVTTDVGEDRYYGHELLDAIVATA